MGQNINTYYKSGDHNAVCDRCGYEYKASQLRKTWDGLWVCSKDWEPRHPQDFVRGIPDEQRPSWTRPESPDGVEQVTWVASLNLEATTGSISSTDVRGNTLITKSFVVSPVPESNSTMTINAPTNPQTNEIITIQLQQNAKGNCVITWNAIFTSIVISHSIFPNAQLTISYKYNGANWVQYGPAEWV